MYFDYMIKHRKLVFKKHIATFKAESHEESDYKLLMQTFFFIDFLLLFYIISTTQSHINEVFQVSTAPAVF